MNISILQENFVKALTHVGRVVLSRPPVPVLGNVLLETSNNGLRVSAANMETSVSVWVGGKVEKDGAVCVPCKLLVEYALTLPAGTVHLAAKGDEIQVSCGGYRASIPGVPASEFPPVATSGGRKKEKIEKNDLVDTLGLVLFSAATDEGRPLLTGVKIRSNKEGGIVAATDGYRLSVVSKKLVGGDDVDMVVPARSLSEVVRLAQEEKAVNEVFLSQSKDDQLVCSVGDSEIATRLIAGEYPQFDKIIPKTHTTRVYMEKAAFERAVKSASIFARDNANIVRLVFEGQRLVVSANAPQVGENKVDVDVKIDGDGGEIAFNSRFLLDFLSNFPEDELLFEMTGSLNPGVFKPVKDESFTHIIMPVRVSS